MKDDSPIVREVRERAMRISECYGHDLHRYCEDLRLRQQGIKGLVSQVTVVAPSPKAPRKAG